MDSESPRLPTDEAKRLEILAAYDLLDTAPEASFDDLVRMASRLAGTPIAVLSLVDDKRMWFKASTGVPVRECARELGMCDFTMREPHWLMVTDALEDERFRDSHLVKNEPHVRSYFGIPLRSPQGIPLGSFAVADQRPRTFSNEVIEDLTALARQVMVHFEMRRQAVARRRQEKRHRGVIHALAAGIWEWSPITDEAVFSRRFCEILGYTEKNYPDSAASHRAQIHPEDRDRVMEILRLQMETGDVFDVEYRAQAADGSYRWIHSHGLVERDTHSDRPERLVGSIVDMTARREAEDRLRASEQRYRDLFDTSPHPMWVYDVETLAFLTVNQAAVTHYGYSREEFLSMTIKDIRPSKDMPGLSDEVSSEGKPDSEASVGQHLCRDGRLIDVEINARSFTFKGRPARLVIVHDITARLAAEASLRLSEERFSLVARATQDVLWDWNIQTGEIWWNENVSVLFGYRPEELVTSKEDWLERIHEDDRASVEASLMALFESTDIHWSAQYRFRRANGLYAFVLDRGFAIRNPEGILLRLIGSITDLTERLETEARLRKQAALLDRTQDAILVCDLDLRITYWNRSAERLYGWREEEALRRPLGDVCGLDLRRHGEAYERVVAAGEWFGDLHQNHREKGEFLVESRWTLMLDPQNQPEAILMVNTDVTEKRKIEAQYLRSQRVEAIGNLAGGIAHDLNNVLAPILMSIGILRPQVESSDGRRLLRTIETSARRGADMVKQVLSFARGVEGDNIPVSPRHLFDIVEDAFWDTFPKSIQLRVDIAAGAWSLVGDPTQLHQVLLNLCINARDAMPNGGILTLGAENVRIDPHYAALSDEVSAGPHVLLTVTDTGEGIPESFRTKIFDPFFTTKEQGKGTGLGLATVMSIVRSHRGFIRLESEEGKGTTFKLYFPADEAVPTPSRVEGLGHMPRGAGELILVVDDETAVRHVTQQTLEAFGYRVLTAAHGQEAVAHYIANQKDIALVMTDMMMPVMDGPATIRALQAINPDVRIIATSGHVTNGHATKISTLGINQFLSKPYTAEALLKAVNAILAKG